MKPPISKLQFCDYKITDVKYNCDPNYKDSDSDQLKLSFEKKLNRIDEKGFQIDLAVNVHSEEEHQTNPKIEIYVLMKARFVAEPEFNRSWEASALAIMFPYIRSFITMLSVQSGADPIILPTVNIAAMFQKSGLSKPEDQLPKEPEQPNE